MERAMVDSYLATSIPENGPRSLHSNAVESIAFWLTGGRFKGGDLLPNETEIGFELGISRTVVREAIRTLAAKGMVQVRRRIGMVVLPITEWSLFDPQVMAWRFKFTSDQRFVDDITAFRASVETIAAEICAARDDFDGKILHDCCDAMEASLAGQGDWFAADLAFHRHLLRETQNQFLLHMQPMLDSFFDAFLSPEVLRPENMRQTLPYHRAIAEAVTEGNPTKARDMMLQLVNKGREDVLQRISSNRRC